MALVELELEMPPSSPEQMEVYFQEHVATAEALAAKGGCISRPRGDKRTDKRRSRELRQGCYPLLPRSQGVPPAR